MKKLTVEQKEELACREAEELCQQSLAKARSTFACAAWGSEEEESASNEGGWGSTGAWGKSNTGGTWANANGGEGSGWGTSRDEQKGGEEAEAEPPIVPLGRLPRRTTPALPPPDIQPHRDPWDTINWGNEPSTPHYTVYGPAPEPRKPTFVPGTIPGTNIPFNVILDREFLALMLTTANDEEEAAEEAAAETAPVPDKDPKAARAHYMRTFGFRASDDL
ncbi:unnamed protein product [Closterium sp. NIES-54]